MALEPRYVLLLSKVAHREALIAQKIFDFGNPLQDRILADPRPRGAGPGQNPAPYGPKKALFGPKDQKRA